MGKPVSLRPLRFALEGGGWGSALMDRHPKMAVSEERQGQPWQVGAGLEICGPDRVCHRQVTVLSGLGFPICSVRGDSDCRTSEAVCS